MSDYQTLKFILGHTWPAVAQPGSTAEDQEGLAILILVFNVRPSVLIVYMFIRVILGKKSQNASSMR